MNVQIKDIRLRIKQNLSLVMLCNLIFLFYIIFYVKPSCNLLLSVIINLIVFIVPGLGWFGVFQHKLKDSVYNFLIILLFSTAILFSGILFFFFTHVEINSFYFLIYLIVITNVGILMTKCNILSYLNFNKNWKRYSGILLISILMYFLLFYSAAEIVPPLEDHDMEIQGTMYGLIHYLRPYMVTNRDTIFFLAHPLLLHFYSSYAVLFSGSLDNLTYYYIAAKQNIGVKRIPKRVWKDEFARFNKNFKEILFGRIVNILFSILTLFVIFEIVFYLTKSKSLSLLSGMLYCSFPEVFVRSSYGGYMAITNFFLLTVTYFYITASEERHKLQGYQFALLISCFLLALSNHKAVILPLAILVRELLVKRQIFLKYPRGFLSPAIIGFGLGTLLFWIYGLSVDAETFILDHVKLHFLYQIKGSFIERWRFHYPSVAKLWAEFNQNLGVPFLLLSLPINISLLKNIRKKESIFTFWFLVGAVLFSLVAWKQTKHLMLVILPLVIPMFLFISTQKPKIKTALILVIASIIVRNIWVIFKLALDFKIMKPTPDW